MAAGTLVAALVDAASGAMGIAIGGTGITVEPRGLAPDCVGARPTAGNSTAGSERAVFASGLTSRPVETRPTTGCEPEYVGARATTGCVGARAMTGSELECVGARPGRSITEGNPIMVCAVGARPTTGCEPDCVGTRVTTGSSPMIVCAVGARPTALVIVRGNGGGTVDGRRIGAVCARGRPIIVALGSAVAGSISFAPGVTGIAGVPDGWRRGSDGCEGRSDASGRAIESDDSRVLASPSETGSTVVCSSFAIADDPDAPGEPEFWL